MNTLTIIGGLLLLLSVWVQGYPHADVLLAEIGEPQVREIAGNASASEQELINEDKVTYSGAQLWKVVVNTNEKRRVIAKLRDAKEISPWGGNITTLDILVHSKYISHVKDTLKDAKMTYELMIPDIQRAIDLENPEPSEEEEELANRKGHRMTWSAYHRLTDIYGYLDYLAITYPSLCTVKTIGTSVQGRPIKLLKVSNGNSGNKAIWLDGGVHAREWISPATVTYIINQFVENYDTESEDVQNIDWYFTPVVNPDGYEYSHTKDRLWRKNRSAGGLCAGTDLNRNFGYKWGGKGSSKNPCTEIYGGSSAFSEPETQAIRNFILSSGANFKAYITFHSYGQYILYPWGYDRFVTPDHKDMQNVAQKAAQLQLKDTQQKLEEKERTVNKQTFGIHRELESVTEQLKDTKEQNTALQLQLDNLTKTHQELKISYDEVLTAKKSLEMRFLEIDTSLSKCKSELILLKKNHEKLSESERNLRKQLEIEKLQTKTAKLQNENDAKSIQDLNRQVKEMERIIQRKHPDSVSALLLANKKEDSNAIATRTVLENRIKQLEQEANQREAQSNTVFTEIHEKFNHMKVKYERHIEDLEIHVNDLKSQLKCKSDTYDMYTQTYTEIIPKSPEQKNTKELSDNSTQTEQPTKPIKTVINKKPEKIVDTKEDSYLLATIRGLQSELSLKERTLNKLQKELDELRKTNRKLQKDRETNLKNFIDRKESKFLERPIIAKSPEPPSVSDSAENEIYALREERDKIKTQLVRLEEEFQNLKTKRLQDLNILQEAHEREITTYMSNIGPMREQLDVQQISINNLQQQLATAKEELAILTIERDHLDSRLKNITAVEIERGSGDENQLSLQKKIAYLERRYEEREHRLRAIVHGLAQKQVTSRDCEQCAARQQQLIGYKAELDQLLATLKYLQ